MALCLLNLSIVCLALILLFCNAREQNVSWNWLVLQTLKFLDMEENEGVTPQSYFRVKEGSGVGKRVANKIVDIGIVEEQVLNFHHQSAFD